MNKIKLFLIISLCCMFIGCTKTAQERSLYEHQPANGIYYWRTTFQVSEAEQQFLSQHNIKRLYLRLFDVEMTQRNLWENTQPQPVATLLFRDKDNLTTTMQAIDEVVPTVFITLDALKQMQGEEDSYAQKITMRVLNMCSYNCFRDKVHEVQIDCDWTASTQDGYFLLLNKIRDLLHEQKCLLSVTVRLHQLRTEVPPADRGVLMIYNTGSFRLLDTENSILSYKDATQYLKHFSYSLPLDYAFPAFGWGVWFRGNKFMAILHQQDYSDSQLYSPLPTSSNLTHDSDSIPPTRYKVLQEHTVDGHILQAGDIIRHEVANFDAVEQLKQLLPFTDNTSIILYHLDENNLKQYTDHETEILYTRPATH